MKIVSACLAGIECAYDGKNRLNKKVRKLVKQGKAIPVCPEQLGGLPTPRIPSERAKDKVVNKNGVDITENFRKGAREALKIAQLVDCKCAILKSRSPSCGYGKIYDGTFSNTLINGNGVFADLLVEQGIKILTEQNASSA
ncbi:MAG: DUF523 domain-containing protein, partial [Candidatus Marinimicrobia bacterium]|nr:DUF523 domain-containing protein [Candidatus Neomarinimicrobiota bacterium]